MMNDNGAEFLARLYQPPLPRFPNPVEKPHEWAKAAAWGEALKEWLAGYNHVKTRKDYRQAVAHLLSFCRKLPWEVRAADVAQWLKQGLAGKASHTQKNALERVCRFYHFACGRTWNSPKGKQLWLCQTNPVEGIVPPKVAEFKRAVALNEAELERLQAAFDLDTPYGRRDHALFKVILETGMHLREALSLQLRDIAPQSRSEGATGDGEPFRGQKAAWEAVRAYLEANGRLAGMGPEDYVFTPLMDVAGAMAKRNPLDWERQPLGERTASMAFKEYVRCAGLDPDKVRPETLRYSGARRLLEAGASLQDVMAFLGIKNLPKARQMAKRLQSPMAQRSAGRQPAKTRQRRRPGGQPDQQGRLKHGKWSERYQLSRLGIPWGSVRDLGPERAPWVIAELRAMERELAELEPDTIDAALKRLYKVSHIAVTIGQVMRVWFRNQRKEEGEEE
jgi:site-specific recombinase XerD